jgi:hypothetical protein
VKPLCISSCWLCGSRHWGRRKKSKKDMRKGWDENKSKREENKEEKIRKRRG